MGGMSVWEFEITLAFVLHTLSGQADFCNRADALSDNKHPIGTFQIE